MRWVTVRPLAPFSSSSLSISASSVIFKTSQWWIWSNSKFNPTAWPSDSWQGNISTGAVKSQAAESFRRTLYALKCFYCVSELAAGELTLYLCIRCLPKDPKPEPHPPTSHHITSRGLGSGTWKAFLHLNTVFVFTVVCADLMFELGFGKDLRKVLCRSQWRKVMRRPRRLVVPLDSHLCNS